MLGRLRARYGVFAVLGNHDHWTDAALITDLFRAEGITVLVNQGMRFELGDEAFWLAGVDDTMVGLEDLSLALAGARESEMKLLLAHNPIILRRAARAHVDLGTSGHTHGGQVKFSFQQSASGAQARLLRGLGRKVRLNIRTRVLVPSYFRFATVPSGGFHSWNDVVLFGPRLTTQLWWSSKPLALRNRIGMSSRILPSPNC